jgi:2-isopropylmalate synthase
MALSMPSDHTPRYTDFEISGVSDETMREGGERALFGADDGRKLKLIEALSEAGIRDIDVGSGLTEPSFIHRILDDQHLLGRIAEETTFSFNLTLKTWEPLYEALKGLPREHLEKIYVSVGMIEIEEENNLFEHVVEKLSDIGVGRFRSSILNAFSTEVDDERYGFLQREIDRCRQLGISLVRVNDSVGTLLPQTTEVLAANLTRDNPDMTFYLHGHNDRGLGTANSLTSIFHGFDMIEGGVGGFGNRAGLPVLEALSSIFDENNITLASGPLDTSKLASAAALAEETFMVVPDPYRPISGMLVENENAGIVNVPDYLGVSRRVDYFLNQIGLFPVYVKQMLSESGMAHQYTNDDEFVNAVWKHLYDHMGQVYWTKREKFGELMSSIREFYTDIVRIEDVELAALEVLHGCPAGREGSLSASAISADQNAG